MTENPIPKPTVRPATGSSWQASDVRAVLCNPVNVGLGPFKQLVPEDLWLKGAEKQVAEHGAEQFLVNVLFMLKDSFKRVQGHPSRDVGLETDNILATGCTTACCAEWRTWRLNVGLRRPLRGEKAVGNRLG